MLTVDSQRLWSSLMELARIGGTAKGGAVYLSRIAPTAMVFGPCAGGIRHNELESARPEHLAAGCDVLLHAVLRPAGAMAAS
jgi:acetylornithine deacetylase/succinyl-diaminopimelate desuccinylase-like protein